MFSRLGNFFKFGGGFKLNLKKTFKSISAKFHFLQGIKIIVQNDVSIMITMLSVRVFPIIKIITQITQIDK